MFKNRLIISFLIASLFSLANLFISPVYAISKPTVYIKASQYNVTEGVFVNVSGSVSHKSAGATVKLQKKIAGNWKNIQTSKVNASKKYLFRTKVNYGLNSYRVYVIRTPKIYSAVSRTISITGSADESDYGEPLVPAPEGPADDSPPNTNNEPTPEPTPQPATPKIADFSDEELRYQLNIKIDEYRKSRGLSPLGQEVSLKQYSQDWSDYQSSINQTTLRENLSSGIPANFESRGNFVTFNGLPEDVISFLEYQNLNLLIGDSQWIGIGISRYNSEIAYWTIDFAVSKESTPPAPSQDWNEATVRNLILQKTNEFRAQNGKPALRAHSSLDSVAQNWSNHMAANNDFRHNPNFSSQIPGGWTRAGENIAAGQRPEDVVDAWINSSGHRANLLGDFTHLGVGYAYGTNSSYGRYYTQNFAKY